MPRHLRQARRGKQESGFVLLVVMFVLLMAGTSSMVALDGSRNALRSAGHTRMATQVGYLAEGVLQYGIVLADNVADPLIGIPNLNDFGQPALPEVGYADKAYQFTPGQFDMARLGTYEAPVWADPDTLTDPVGTMGPGGGWSPSHALAAGHQHMAVHFIDCVSGKTAGAPGTQMAGGHVSQAEMTITQYCLGRGRARSAAPNSPTRTWAVAGLADDYIQQLLAVDRSTAATVVITRENVK